MIYTGFPGPPLKNRAKISQNRAHKGKNQAKNFHKGKNCSNIGQNLQNRAFARK
jgi:hypothetical protein